MLQFRPELSQIFTVHSGGYRLVHENFSHKKTKRKKNARCSKLTEALLQMEITDVGSVLKFYFKEYH